MKKLKRRIFKYTIIIVAVIVLLIGLLFSLVYFGHFGALPDKTKLLAIRNEEASLVISSDNIILGKYFSQNRTNIKWEKIPTHLKNALIATEDKRFFNHGGYDFRSYFRVFFKTIIFRSNSGGGSTLTQQLIKNLYGRGNYGILTIPVNKIKEMIIAGRIEDVYSKNELLLLYLNSVPFGEDVYGVESASHRYFNKTASALKIEESAVLVGLLKANTYFNPQLNPENSRARRNQVLTLMKTEHYLSAKASDSLQKLPLVLHYENFNLRNPAGYFVYQVKKKALEIIDSIKNSDGKEYNLDKEGLKIYTTLNSHIQQIATLAVKNQLVVMQKLLDNEFERNGIKKQWYKKHKKLASNEDLANRDITLFNWEGNQIKNISGLDSLWYYYKMLNASLLITNPKNGEVITWIGGNDFRILPFDMVLSHRQIASAFKPVLYATALEKGVAPCSYLENEMNKYPGYEDWEPQNDNHVSTPDSTVAFWYALAHSMNLPTIDLYFKLGRENLVNTCKKLNFPDFPNDAPSNALGTLDLSLNEIVKAYATFANQGKMNDLVMIKKITDSNGKVLYKRKVNDPVDVFSKETSEQITALLQEVVNHGTGARIRGTYGIKTNLAGKTGTAQDFSNAWFIAYTPDMVIGTWVGASTPEAHFYSRNGSGSMLALPIVGNVIKEIEKDPLLRKKYLTPFNFPEDKYAFLQCEPYRQKVAQGFFKKLFNKNPEKENENQENDKKKQKTQKKKSFFQKLFGSN